jgi:hypothetical protein
MPKDKNITAADATAVLAIEELYPSGVALEQYATDALAAHADETISETRMGVDGQMVAGFIPTIKTVTLNFEASSPSLKVLDDLYYASQKNKTFYRLTLTLNIPALNKTVTYSGGVLKQYKPVPDIAKTLQPVAAVIDFERVS